LKKSLFLIIQTLLPLQTNAALPIYPAEIIGRDLDIPRTGSIGHVGITTAPNIGEGAYQVIEVLWETPVIQTNTIANFRARSPYWGSRYGISDRGSNALRILREANFQKDLGCATYTTTASYSVSTGGYDPTGKPKPTYCGYFRCDTFVNYVFHWGNYSLPTYSPPGSIETVTFPYLVFNAFPKGNGDGPRAINSMKTTVQKRTDILINNITAEQLSAMSEEEFVSVVDVSNEKINQEGIENIFNLTLKSTLSLESRVFLMDKLGFVGTLDTIPKLIKLYKNLNVVDIELKNQIIATTQNIRQRLINQSEFQENILLQKFYEDLLTQKLFATQKEIVIRSFLALSPKSVIISHLDLINSLLEDTSLNFHPRIVIGLKLELFNMLYETREIGISDVVNFLKKENNAELDGVFTLFVVNRLSHLGTNGLDKESKNQISSYLDSIKFKNETQNKNHPVDGITMFSQGQWLEASALVNSNSLEEAGKYIARYLQRNSLIGQESYIIGLSNSKYMKRAFENEPLLNNFKKKNKDIFLNTVGLPTR